MIALAAAAALLGPATGAATAATWTVADPPYPAEASVPFAPLYGVGAVSPKDVWAVGESSGVPVLDQWSGHSWSAGALPSGPCSAFESDCALTGVSGASASDVIAVGHGVVPTSSGWLALPLAFQWSGRAWAPMALPAGLPYEAVEHVVNLATDDAWAVGVGATVSGASTVSALDWNGSTWTSVSTGFTTSNDLTVNVVSGSSPTDVWVAGQTVTPGYHNRQFTSVLLHYNGLAWQQVAVPDQSGLLDLDAVSPVSAWAVAADGAILNWNGSTWSVQSDESGAQQVAALSPSDVWVAGIVSVGHFNGSTWSTTATPSTVSGLDGAAVAAPGDVWFAGYYYAPGTTEIPVVLSTSNG